MNKKLLGLLAVPVIAVAGSGAALLSNQSTTGATDEPPIVQQVNTQGEELANHEARITNSENNIKDLQANTGTPPSSSNITVPVTSTGAPISTTPKPKVVSYRSYVAGDPPGTYCEYTLNDGTTFVWIWKLPASGTVDDRYCDDRAIGLSV